MNKQQMKFIKIPDTEFEMGETPVTNAQWQDIMGDIPSYNKALDCPVETVSYNTILEFIEKLNALGDGYAYSLPYENLWESCAPKDLTEEETLKHAWYYENSKNSTRAVKQKLPTDLGFYDILGNVWELTSSLYSSSRSLRVIRGGGWSSDAEYVRSAHRSYVGPDDVYRDVGFRLARTTAPRSCTLSETLKTVALEEIKKIRAKLSKLERFLK